MFFLLPPFGSLHFLPLTSTSFASHPTWTRVIMSYGFLERLRLFPGFVPCFRFSFRSSLFFFVKVRWGRLLFRPLASFLFLSDFVSEIVPIAFSPSRPRDCLMPYAKPMGSHVQLPSPIADLLDSEFGPCPFRIGAASALCDLFPRSHALLLIESNFYSTDCLPFIARR